MRVEICKGKGLMSAWGDLSEGMRVDISDHAADNWIGLGIAFAIDGEGRPLSPVDVPEGMFWCREHATLHKLDSKPGRKCNERQVKEAAEVEEARAEVETAREKAQAALESEGEESEDEPDEKPEGDEEPEGNEDPEPADQGDVEPEGDED